MKKWLIALAAIIGGGVIALVIAQEFQPGDFDLGELGKPQDVQALSAGDDIEARKQEAEKKVQDQLLQEYYQNKAAQGQ